MLNFHDDSIKSCFDLGIAGRGILSKSCLRASHFNVVRLWQCLKSKLSVNCGRLDLNIQSAWILSASNIWVTSKDYNRDLKDFILMPL